MQNIEPYSHLPEYVEALEWYRRMLDLYDPDHHLNYHQIYSSNGPNNKVRRGYVRLQLKSHGHYKDFVLTTYTRAALIHAVDEARTYRKTIPTNTILAKRKIRSNVYYANVPGVTIVEQKDSLYWNASLGKDKNGKVVRIRKSINHHGELKALRECLECRKEYLMAYFRDLQPRLLTETYTFDR